MGKGFVTRISLGVPDTLNSLITYKSVPVTSASSLFSFPPNNSALQSSNEAAKMRERTDSRLAEKRLRDSQVLSRYGGFNQLPPINKTRVATLYGTQFLERGSAEALQQRRRGPLQYQKLGYDTSRKWAVNLPDFQEKPVLRLACVGRTFKLADLNSREDVKYLGFGRASTQLPEADL